jgi:hypothetical protein
MEENLKQIEMLFMKATEYGKISLELAKLKALDKTSNVVSSVFPLAIVSVLLLSFLFFVNLGIALWLGDLLHNIYYGFFIAGGFYGLIGLVFYFTMYKRTKTFFYNYIIRLIQK